MEDLTRFEAELERVKDPISEIDFGQSLDRLNEVSQLPPEEVKSRFFSAVAERINNLGPDSTMSKAECAEQFINQNIASAVPTELVDTLVNIVEVTEDSVSNRLRDRPKFGVAEWLWASEDVLDAKSVCILRNYYAHRLEMNSRLDISAEMTEFADDLSLEEFHKYMDVTTVGTLDILLHRGGSQKVNLTKKLTTTFFGHNKALAERIAAIDSKIQQRSGSTERPLYMTGGASQVVTGPRSMLSALRPSR